MAKSLSQALLDNLKQRKGTVVTEREMKGLKKRWGPHNCKDRKIDAYAESEAFEEAGPFKVSEEQTAKGLAWWKSKVFKPDGAVRDTAFVRDNQLRNYHFNILLTFKRFEFVGWEFIGNSPDWQWPFPVYRVVGKNGDSFRYTARSWQSGGSIVG